MNYLTIFLTGLTSGGVSCALIQGGLLASLIAGQKQQEIKAHAQTTKADSFDKLDYLPSILFLLSKLISHTILGLFLGWIGSYLMIGTPWQLLFQFLAAAFVLFTAYNLWQTRSVFCGCLPGPLAWFNKFFQKAQLNIWTASLILGVVTILVPCGVTQAMEVLAVSSGQASTGAFVMFTFILGTSPIFFLIGLSTAKLSEIFRQKFLKAAAFLLLIIALINLNGILVVLDAPLTWQKLTQPIYYFFSSDRFDLSSHLVTTDQNGVQHIIIDITSDGYSPNYFKVKAKSPVELTLKTHDTYSCAATFVLKAFEIDTKLKPNDVQVFKFTPSQKGQFSFACSMGMYAGLMEVI